MYKLQRTYKREILRQPMSYLWALTFKYHFISAHRAVTLPLVLVSELLIGGKQEFLRSDSIKREVWSDLEAELCWRPNFVTYLLCELKQEINFPEHQFPFLQNQKSPLYVEFLGDYIIAHHLLTIRIVKIFICAKHSPRRWGYK